MHGGKLVAKALKQAGVEVVFTLSGGHVMAIYDGCLDEGIKVVDVRHEQAAVHAADAWARLNPGKVGVAILTAGPGATDGVTGLANAWRANSPILVFGGQGPLANLRKGSLQEMDHISVMRPISKWAEACYATDRLGEYVEEAIRHALSGNPGPAYIEIPMDVLGGPVDLDTAYCPAPLPTPQVRPARESVREAVTMLAASKQPMIMVGTGVKWSNGRESLGRFLDAVKMPAFCNGMGRGQVDHDSPWFFNRTRRDYLEQTDCVVLAGSLLDFRMRFGASIPATAKIIQLDLDAVQIGQNRRADIGLVGNLGLTLQTMLEVMQEDNVSMDWSGVVETWRAKEDEAEETMRARLNSDEVPIDPQRLCREIADFVDDDTIVIGDGGDIVAQAAKVIKVPKNGAWMDPGPLGTLGVGMPFALAAQLAHPDKRVLIVYGDGSFGLNGFEFDTAVRFGLPIVGIIGNDQAWGQMLRPQAGLFGEDRLVATELAATRYDKVVEALGGHGELVTEPDQIRPALERAYASGKPACVNVMMRQDREFSGGIYV
ncbi:MAG TPA: acetolactate synthase [Deltaproteobacteria bacterium]|nr:acetolactate synthase [Candidatus Binatota bacterium]HIL12298.1 acetolactate synthase [Deltaproteobacteria bacterium]